MVCFIVDFRKIYLTHFLAIIVLGLSYEILRSVGLDMKDFVVFW